MSDLVEIELEGKLIEFIDKAAKEEGLTQNDFINKIIKELVDEFS